MWTFEMEKNVMQIDKKIWGLTNMFIYFSKEEKWIIQVRKENCTNVKKWMYG